MLQAAAEYVGVMLSNGLRVVEATVQDAGRWLVAHPVEAGAGALALILLGKFLRR